MSQPHSEAPSWYERQYGDALDFGEGYAERKWHHEGRRSFSAATFVASRGESDSRAAGQWTAAWFDCLLEEREVSIIPLEQPRSIAACWNEIVAAHRTANAVPERRDSRRLVVIEGRGATGFISCNAARKPIPAFAQGRPAATSFMQSNGDFMADRRDDAAASGPKTPRPQWHVGQLWQERKPFRNGLVRIEAITDHPETPVIGRCTRTGLVDCYGLNGAWESDGMFRQIGEVSDGDLVTLIEDANAFADTRKVG